MNEPCMFCGARSFDYEYDEGIVEGCACVEIGDRMICTGCLNQLKHALLLVD